MGSAKKLLNPVLAELLGYGYWPANAARGGKTTLVVEHASRYPPITACRIENLENGVILTRHSAQKTSLARSGLQSSAPRGSTLLDRLFHRSPSSAHDTSPCSPLGWARNFLKPRRHNGEEIELHGRSPAVIEVPYAKGKRRNASAREKRKGKPLPLKNPTATSSQPQAVISNSSTTPAVGDNTAATTSKSSRPDVMLRQAGLWTRFWLFIGCLSPEYTDGRH